MLDRVCVLVESCFLSESTFSRILEAPLLAMFPLVLIVVAVDATVVLEVVLTLARKLNGDEFVTGVVLKPVNVPNALFVAVP